MVKLIIITTAGDFVKAAATLKRMRNRLPQMTRLGMRRWGKILERDMKYAARQAGITNYTGLLQGKGIDYRQGKRSDKGYLFMRIYGIYLDGMNPHFVSVTRRRTRLLAWSLRARSSNIRTKAMAVQSGQRKTFSIYVRPKPFIAAGYRRARPKLKAVLKRAAARAVKGA